MWGREGQNGLQKPWAQGLLPGSCHSGPRSQVGWLPIARSVRLPVGARPHSSAEAVGVASRPAQLGGWACGRCRGRLCAPRQPHPHRAARSRGSHSSLCLRIRGNNEWGVG